MFDNGVLSDSFRSPLHHMLVHMTAQTREALGNRIRELRKANGLSQQKLALMVNVERSYLAKLEQGKRNPSIDCLEKIAGGLDVTLSELFAGLETSGTDAIRNPKADAISIASSSVRNGYFALKLPSE